MTRAVEDGVGGPPSLTLACCRLLTTPARRDASASEPGSIAVTPLSGAPTEWLYQDGDWRRGLEFFWEESPRPDLGLHSGFHWSRGRRCRLMVKVERGGLRTLRLAVTGFIEGQQVRPVLSGTAYDWSPPLPGETGRVQLLEWVLPLREGVVEVVVELSTSSGDAFRDLGIIIVDLQLGDFLVDAASPSPQRTTLAAEQ